MNLNIDTSVTAIPSTSGVEYADPVVEIKEEDDDVFWFEEDRIDSKLPKANSFGFRNFEEIGDTVQEKQWYKAHGFGVDESEEIDWDLEDISLQCMIDAD